MNLLVDGAGAMKFSNLEWLHFNHKREQYFVAEVEGIIAGAIFITDEEKESHGTARIRLLHVEPFARRRGIGDALVQWCISFAPGKGIKEIHFMNGDCAGSGQKSLFLPRVRSYRAIYARDAW